MPKQKPFLKWVGGKTRSLPAILPLFPAQVEGYHEPFLGGGAVFFALAAEKRFKRAFLSDANQELVTTYRAVRDDVDAVVAMLRLHQREHSEHYYYAMRALNPKYLGAVDTAARMIYLNKTGFNGLYRVNKSGGFNVPLGDYENPTILDEENLRACCTALRGSCIECCKFADLDLGARVAPRDVVYIDPPYVPLSATSSFVAYQGDGFTRNDQAQVERRARQLRDAGACVVLSNSDTEDTRKLYADWCVTSLRVGRSVSSKSGKRGKVGELLIHNKRDIGSGAVIHRA